jgi:hypothetical protein
MEIVMSQFDPEFTGEQLRLLIVDIEGAIGSHRAGWTPLGAEIIQLCEERWRAWKAQQDAAMTKLKTAAGEDAL